MSMVVRRPVPLRITAAASTSAPSPLSVPVSTTFLGLRARTIAYHPIRRPNLALLSASHFCGLAAMASATCLVSASSSRISRM